MNRSRYSVPEPSVILPSGSFGNRMYASILPLILVFNLYPIICCFPSAQQKRFLDISFLLKIPSSCFPTGFLVKKSTILFYFGRILSRERTQCFYFNSILRHFFFSNRRIFKRKILPTEVNDLPGRQKSKEIAHIKSQNIQSSSMPVELLLEPQILKTPRT